jgi:preprotein translocase subunit SecE
MSRKTEEKEMERRMKALEKARKQAASRAGSAKTKTGEKVGLFKRITNFLKDVKRELKKVSWPPRQETISSTWVVVTVVFIFGAYFWFVDTIIGFLIRKLLTMGLD